MFERGKYRNANMRRAQPAISDPAPENRVHLRHVRAPQHESIGRLEIVIATHGLVHAEGPHESHDGRRHTMPCIWIDVVGSEAGLEQFVGGIAFPDRPLARSKHANTGRPALCKRSLELLSHHIEGFVPRHLGEFTILVVFTVLLAQKRMREAIVAVHYLREKISFDAIETAIDLGLGVAVSRDNSTIFRTHHHTPTGPTKSTGPLFPFQLVE